MEKEKSQTYIERKEKAKNLYDSFGKVSCPALGNELVHFTSEGFNHLVYKTKRKERDERVQIMKFDLLEKAKLIIEKSTTFQEYEELYEYVITQKHGKRVSENTLIRAWGLVAMVKKFRVKVVIR